MRSTQARDETAFVMPAMEDAPCAYRCKAGDEEVIVGRDRLHDLPGRYRVVRCRNCGLMRTSPRPTAEAMGQFYPADYNPYQVVHASAELPSLLRRLAARIIDFRVDTVPDMPPGRMLEIGCASGNFLDKMTRKGWQVQGVEFAASAAEAARQRGLDVTVSRVEDMPDHLVGYDLITGWMIVEHLHQPLEALTSLAARARPGGWLALSVPNAGSWSRRVFGDNWFALQTPTHLTHFTPATLRHMLETAGWNVRSVKCQRIISDIPASLGNVAGDIWPDSAMVARLRKRLKNPTLAFNLLTYPLSVLLAALMQTDRLIVLAQRKG